MKACAYCISCHHNSPLLLLFINTFPKHLQQVFHRGKKVSEWKVFRVRLNLPVLLRQSVSGARIEFSKSCIGYRFNILKRTSFMHVKPSANCANVKTISLVSSNVFFFCRATSLWHIIKRNFPFGFDYRLPPALKIARIKNLLDMEKLQNAKTKGA